MGIERGMEENGLHFELAAFDLDGTVLRRDLVITERTVAALDALREKGVRLVVATGRRFEGASEQAKVLGCRGTDPVICYGGAMVRRMNGETLLHRVLSREIGIEILEWAAERKLHTRIFTDGRIIISPDTPAVLEHLSRSARSDVLVVDSPAGWLRSGGENPTKLVLVDHPKDIERWLEQAREEFRGRLFVTRSLPHNVEISSLGGTKSKALEFLCERWGIDPGRVLAFGDADNDVDMLRFAGHGVAVGGITQEVREAADAVARPVHKDGVALYVEKLLGEY